MPSDSEEGRSNTREWISVEKQPEFPPNSKTPRESSPAPHVQLSDGSSSGLCVETENVECAVIALSSWNEKSLSEQGPEYELIEALGCKRMVGPTIFHCNFIARPKSGRPKSGSEADDKLFFAELKYSKDFAKDGEDVALGCHVCCILGPSGTETGLCGCISCELHHTLIHHPRNRDFIPGRQFALLKYMIKKGRRPSHDGRAPFIKLSYHYDTPPEEVVRHYVEIGLSSWNEKSLSEQGPEYELVDVLGCKRMIGPCIYHCNFIAKPKNGSEAKTMLFFAEMKCADKIGRVSCTACILGPSGTKTGLVLVGCKICVMHPDLVQHPENGEFTKGRVDALQKAIAKAERASMNWKSQLILIRVRESAQKIVEGELDRRARRRGSLN